MALVNSLTVAYTKAIYRDGTRTFPTIKPEYVDAVKQHAAAGYTLAIIDNALAVGYITQQEWDETVACLV